MDSSHTYVTTEAGRGYRFVAPVHFGKFSDNRCRLPGQVSKIIGHDEIVTDLLEDIGQHRLITVVGPSGIGKTTAALCAARLALRDHRVDAAAFVDLAAAVDSSHLPRTVSDAIPRQTRMMP
jgi:ABC-type enterochelin transport system ATPase subunit